ncbi:MAG: hypothetical protein O9326_17680 [Microcystis sp. LE19-338.1B]|nr:hypothetical protein [Microcystis sp. LE19-338.1B]MCZ8360808.1 hypothetical protein [Microcystis sp. LE19-388.1G]
MSFATIVPLPRVLEERYSSSRCASKFEGAFIFSLILTNTY